MDRIGADDPNIADRVEQHYIEELMREIMGDVENARPRHPNTSAAWAVFKLLLFVLFVVAAAGITAKLAWLLIQTLFGV